jgi:hypothetical protein
MTLENEGHQIYLWKLLCRLKFKEMDEEELRELEQSPFGGQILNELMTRATNKNIPKDIGLIDSKTIDLILKRVSNWPETSKSVGRQWDDKQIKDYLISMIIPHTYTEDMISRLTIEFKERVK